ncbi:hypothetical protein LJR189_004789 [Acidovorax delafieldii]|uniref:hypothetical protein n=1 Tax=Acidovorax delafieldii TaxID=47920 RepID=UPI003ECF4058
MNETKTNDPVLPGHIKLVHLQQEGCLQAGDIVETQRLGRCKVAYIQTANSICVVNPAGQYFNLSGFGFNARLESRSPSAT